MRTVGQSVDLPGGLHLASFFVRSVPVARSTITCSCIILNARVCPGPRHVKFQYFLVFVIVASCKIVGANAGDLLRSRVLCDRDLRRDACCWPQAECERATPQGGWTVGVQRSCSLSPQEMRGKLRASFGGACRSFQDCASVHWDDRRISHRPIDELHILRLRLSVINNQRLKPTTSANRTITTATTAANTTCPPRTNFLHADPICTSSIIFRIYLVRSPNFPRPTKRFSISPFLQSPCSLDRPIAT